ncbi:MAG: universal stress protein [Halolamina sp.]|uniref:universal stress protein n=1 Tax=Halolamina sp. TaxID=1940283 RepID=UPI002FC2913D
MYENILIPVDGSDEAEKGIKHGIELAAAVGATVHGLYVIEEGGNPWLNEPMDDQMDSAREYGNDITGSVADRAADAGVESVTAVEVGTDVAKKINEYAVEEGNDVIVMGSGYKGKIGSLLGSTAEKVLRSSEIPVITLRRTQDS